MEIEDNYYYYDYYIPVLLSYIKLQNLVILLILHNQ